jgi:sugar lactone lactonase YvrE
MEEIVLEHRCILGEGPVWDKNRQTICWVDILRGEIHEYNPAKNSHKTLFVNQMIGAITICTNGQYIAALKNGFGFVDRNSGAVTMISNPEPHLPGNRFNDGKSDPGGRFWAGTMSHTDEPEQGNLYVLNTDLSVTKKIGKISISNGLAWSTDHKTFYYIDTPTFSVAAFDFDKASGAVDNKRTVIRIAQNDGSPDGMTIDSEGMLWIAHWDGWQVTRWNPLTGKKIMNITMPVARVTSCCFGGQKYQDLYITSARTGLGDDQLKKQPLAGSLFVIKNIGFNGLPAFEFDGHP